MPQQCEGWMRTGGAFTLGRPTWSQCEEEARVRITAEQDGQVKTYPACQQCWEQAIATGIKIMSVVPIRAVSVLDKTTEN